MHDRVNQLAKRTFRTEWTHPRLHCSIQVALSLSAESATCLQQCPRLKLHAISDAYAHYKSVISGKLEVHHITFFFFLFFFYFLFFIFYVFIIFFSV